MQSKVENILFQSHRYMVEMDVKIGTSVFLFFCLARGGVPAVQWGGAVP